MEVVDVTATATGGDVVVPLLPLGADTGITFGGGGARSSSYSLSSILFTDRP